MPSRHRPRTRRRPRPREVIAAKEHKERKKVRCRPPSDETHPNNDSASFSLRSLRSFAAILILVLAPAHHFAIFVALF